MVPKICADVPSEVLNPRNTWESPETYDKAARELADAFIKNFKMFEDFADQDILKGAPLQ